MSPATSDAKVRGVHILVGVLGGALVVLMLLEIFLAFLLPRRVKRDPLLARRVAIYVYRPWRALARRLPEDTGDTLLGVYGPFGLLLDLALWVLLLMFGYACLQWAGGGQLAVGHTVDFGKDLYFAAATLVSTSPAGLAAQSTFARVLQVLDAATGLAVLTIVISYLPSLYQAFSRRETTVSQLDARAGSPPSAGRLVARAAERGGWGAVNSYLRGWEEWSAELMETHLSYPSLAYFRSQHVNQNWLAALCTILDASALSVAAAPQGTGRGGALHLRDQPPRDRRPRLHLPGPAERGDGRPAASGRLRCADRRAPRDRCRAARHARGDAQAARVLTQPVRALRRGALRARRAGAAAVAGTGVADRQLAHHRLALGLRRACAQHRQGGSGCAGNRHCLKLRSRVIHGGWQGLQPPSPPTTVRWGCPAGAASDSMARRP